MWSSRAAARLTGKIVNMALVKKSFNRYCIIYHSNAITDEVLIRLFLDDAYRGSLHFYRDGSPLLANSMSSEGLFTIYFHTSRFADIVGILREESPLYILFNTESQKASVYTGHEPVGEEEDA